MTSVCLFAAQPPAEIVKFDSTVPPTAEELAEPDGWPDAAPKVGETLAGYRLERVLGQGVRGTVFLARERALGDRPVVLKVSKRRGIEHLTLARLRHPHIVPVYSFQDDEARDLRIICMPYLGGVTLERVLHSLADQHPSDRTLGRFFNVIDQAFLAKGDVPAWSGTRQLLQGSNYQRAIAWIGVCLAEALHGAHRSGIVHLDLKPSNILLGDDGQPMLLDFHLARPPVERGTAPPERVGGTRGYMAPEQTDAMNRLRRGTEVARPVDGRADLYGLAAVLFEAFGGSPPPEPGVTSSYLLRANPRIGSSLAAAITRCLANDPADRYQNGSDFAAALRDYLGWPQGLETSRPGIVGRLLGAIGFAR